MRFIFTIFCALNLGAVFSLDFVMGINFDAGGKFDQSFNQGTWEGFNLAIEELLEEYDIEALEFEGTPDTFSQGLRTMANEGTDLIVAPGFSQADAIQSISAEFPDTSFVIIDGVAENDNVRSVLFREQEGSFLVGYIAGKLSQTGVVGFVGGMDIPLIRKFGLGYEEGVKYACADCQIIQNFTGVTPAAWNDPAKAKELATLQHSQGADIIYAAAGASGKGVIDFANETMCYDPESLDLAPRNTLLTNAATLALKSEAYAKECTEGMQPIFYIGVDSNQNRFGDTDSNPLTLNHGLTSMLKRVDVAAYNAVQDVVNDEFTGGVQSLGLAEDGVGYALDAYNIVLMPKELIAELEGITAAIIAGEIEVTDYTEQ